MTSTSNLAIQAPWPALGVPAPAEWIIAGEHTLLPCVWVHTCAQCVLCGVGVQGSTGQPCACEQMVLQGGCVSKGRLGVHRKGADAVNPAGEGLDWEKLLVRDLTQCSKESETRLGCNNERFGSIFIS